MALPCCENVEVSRVNSIFCTSVDKVIEEHLNKGIPLVIEGGVSKWPARNWTLDKLCDIVGKNIINVRSNTNCEDYWSGKKYNIRQTTFGEYVSDLLAENKRSVNSYMAVQNIKKAFPQLQEDVIVPDFIGKMHAGPFLWIARKGHYEYCHMDPDDGLLCMLSGRKQVRLFGCCMETMYPNHLGSKGRTIQSQVNCDSPDLDTHPKFKGRTCYHTLLQPEDMLYIPAFWWHQVTAVEVSISINMFWGDAGENNFLNKVMQPPQWAAFSHWLLNIIEQNKDYPSFQRVLSRLPETIRNFLITQWHEFADDQQVATLVTLIMDYLQIDRLPDEVNSGKHPPPLQIRGLLWRK